MISPDQAHIETDEILEGITEEIAKVYAKALKEVKQKQASFLEEYEKERKEMEARLKSGDIDEAYYKKWLKTKALNRSWYEAMVDSLSRDLVGADKIAMAIVKDDVSKVFALNHDWATYSVEDAVQIDTSYTLYNVDAVAELIMAEPNLLPPLKVDVPKDFEWNRSHVAQAITQGILQGEGIPKIAERLASVVEMDYNSAVRTARTAATSAQNAGRLKAFERAKSLGIEVKKQWQAIQDGRTRPSHRDMDLEVRELEERYSNGLRYPGDPTGRPEELWNCRCTQVEYFPGLSDENPERRSKLGGLSYDEWKAGRNPESNTQAKSTTAKSSTQPATYTKSKLQSMDRASLVEIAREHYMERTTLSRAEAEYRFNSLVSSNTKTDLIKYIINRQKERK